MAKTTRKRYTESEALEIKKKFESGVSARDLARAYGRTEKAIYTLMNRFERGLVEFRQGQLQFPEWYLNKYQRSEEYKRKHSLTESIKPLKSKDTRALIDLVIDMNIEKSKKMQIIDTLI